MNYQEILKTCKSLKDKNFKYKNIDDVYSDLEKVEECLETCRNELCLHCGKYKNEHLGVCEGCRWK